MDIEVLPGRWLSSLKYYPLGIKMQNLLMRIASMIAFHKTIFVMLRLQFFAARTKTAQTLVWAALLLEMKLSL
jgi:hypothetical protein